MRPSDKTAEAELRVAIWRILNAMSCTLTDIDERLTRIVQFQRLLDACFELNGNVLCQQRDLLQTLSGDND